MTAALARPIWSALTSRQSAFARGQTPALRYDPEASPFASAPDDTPASIAALSALPDGTPEDRLVFLQQDPFCLPDDLAVEQATQGVQFVLARDLPELTPAHPLQRLTPADIPDMMALAELTKPGPFRARTFELGPFWGVKIGGRLAAMTGERLNLAGYTEVSGVCTHPDFQGQGLAGALSVHVARQILARGDTPFLHAYADNDGAIRLYRKLGFDIRTEVHVGVVKRVR